MLYHDRNVTFWGNACLMLLVLLFGAALAIAGRNDRGAVVRGNDADAVTLAVAVYHPSTELPALLDTLKATGTPACFFVSASAARQAPALLKRMQAEGHTVGTLGYLPLYDGDADAVETDVRLAKAALFACGVDVRYYLTGLRRVEPSVRAADALGLTCVCGTVDLRTGAGTAEDILDRAAAVAGGSILVVTPTPALNAALSDLVSDLGTRYRLLSLDSILEEQHDTKTA